MRATTTIVLLLLLAACWAAWEWIASAAATEPPPIGRPLVRFDSNEVTEIQLRRTEASANLNPLDGVWHFTSPLVDRLDPNAALAIYLGLNGLVLHEIIPHREWRDQDRQLEEFGLGRKSVRVRLLNQEKSTLHDFRLGDVTPWQKDGEPTMYVQWKNGPVPEDILVVGGNLRALLDRPFDALRARQALYLPKPPLAISLRQGEQRLDLQRDRQDQPWRILRPVPERANPAAVDALLKALSTTEATALLDRGQSPLGGTETARLAITMTGGREAEPSAPGTPIPELPEAGRIEAVFHAGPEGQATDIISRWSDRRYDLKLPAATLDWLKPDLNRYRARTLGDYDHAKVLELLIRDPGDAGLPVVIRRENEAWEVFLRDDWHPADAARVQRAIDAMAACPLQGFPTDSLSQPARYGLDQPFLQVGLRDRDGQQEKLAFARKDGQVFAHREAGTSVYQVPDSVIGFLPPVASAWRSRQLFDFSSIDVRQIVLRLPEKDEVTLRYNPEENLWIAAVANTDATASLDVTAAANLASSLERLHADRWMSGTTAETLQALSQPVATLGLTLETINEDGTPGPAKRLRLEFAPAATGFYFGRFAGEPDIFLISASVLNGLGDGLFVSGE
jgi:hypothetical protein